MKIGIGITTTSSRFEIVENSLKILESIINENTNKYERSSCYDHNKMVNDKSMSLFD
jgi:hypothetical protein